MRRVSSTELQNNFGNYLLMAQDQEIIVTRNGKDVARLSGLRGYSRRVTEEAPAQGYGSRKATYEEFLELSRDGQERYEYIDGEILLQASPKTDHQFSVTMLVTAFHQFFTGKGCIPFVAPYDITISRREGDVNVVQPDLMVICDLEEHLGEDGYYHGIPDLIVEVLSEGTKRKDLLKKLNLYLDGGVKEYWIVDTEYKQVTVYRLQDSEIETYLSFVAPGLATSLLFPELQVDLAKIFL